MTLPLETGNRPLPVPKGAFSTACLYSAISNVRVFGRCAARDRFASHRDRFELRKRGLWLRARRTRQSILRVP